MAALRYSEDYHSHFDPKTFLETMYKNLKAGKNVLDGWVLPFMKANYEFWSTFKAPTDEKVRQLEYGGGPSITNVICSSIKVDHIVFSEYTEANRQALKSWIAGDSDAFDWTPVIEMVVLELEQSDKAVDCPLADKDKLDMISNRTDELKRKIKSVVPCDVNKMPIVQLADGDVAIPFDVVSTSLCLETCVYSEAQYKHIVAELCNLLKPNGYLFMNGVLEGTFYITGKEKFYSFPLTEKMVKEAMREAGLEIEHFLALPCNYSEDSHDCKFTFHTYGRKIVEK